MPPASLKIATYTKAVVIGGDVCVVHFYDRWIFHKSRCCIGTTMLVVYGHFVTLASAESCYVFRGSTARPLIRIRSGAVIDREIYRAVIAVVATFLCAHSCKAQLVGVVW